MAGRRSHRDRCRHRPLLGGSSPPNVMAGWLRPGSRHYPGRAGNYKLVKIPVHWPAEIDLSARCSPLSAWVVLCSDILVWQEGGEYVGILLVVGAIAMLLFARWLVSRKKQGKPVLARSAALHLQVFQAGYLFAMLQNISWAA